MQNETLQEAIDQAGSAIQFYWTPDSPPWQPPIVAPEYAGWAEEQKAWRTGVVLMDLCYHMYDTFISGPDATRLLAETTANNYESFEVGQAKQLVAVTNDGLMIADAIIMRTGENAYTLTGISAALNWVTYHAEKGNYDVTITQDSSKGFTPEDPVLFRYQVQGPRAIELLEEVFGGTLPQVKFFHSAEVEVEGRRFRALRHGMAGQAGFELIGNYADAEVVKNALLTAGEKFGLVRVGAQAYASSALESGWIPTPIPAIFSDPALQDYREWLSHYSTEGMTTLQGSYFSDEIADYYYSPWELGYARSIDLDHEFIGRDALVKSKDDPHRTKVTLVFNPDDLRDIGVDVSQYLLAYVRHRVEVDSQLVGVTDHLGAIDPLGTVVGLALVDPSYAKPGTEVTVAWGQHPGPGTPADAHRSFPRVRATVQPAPYDTYARTGYRKD